MKHFFSFLLLLLPFIVCSQTLADYYRNERIGVGLALSFVNMSDDYKNSYINSYIWRPIFIWDIRYQKPTSRGIYIQYRNLMSSDLLSDLIRYQSIDDGTIGERNITSGFFGNLNIGRNIFYNKENGTALSAGLILGSSYIAAGNLAHGRANGFYINAGGFINYDHILSNSAKIKLYADFSKTLTDHLIWFWEKDAYTYYSEFPLISSFSAEMIWSKHFYISAEFMTIFVNNAIPISRYYGSKYNHPIRVNVGAGYRFNF